MERNNYDGPKRTLGELLVLLVASVVKFAVRAVTVECVPRLNLKSSNKREEKTTKSCSLQSAA